jgi:hypothetical protein
VGGVHVRVRLRSGRAGAVPPHVPPPGIAYGVLDQAASPRWPDVTVFSSHRLHGAAPAWVAFMCGCGCGQAAPGPCWACGAAVTL